MSRDHGCKPSTPKQAHVCMSHQAHTDAWEGLCNCPSNRQPMFQYQEVFLKVYLNLFCCKRCAWLFMPFPTDREIRQFPSALPNLLLIWKLTISPVNYLIFRLKPPYFFSVSPLVIFFKTSGHFWCSHLHSPYLSQRQVIKRGHSPQAESLSVPWNCYIRPAYHLQPDIKYTVEISDLQTFLTFLSSSFFLPKELQVCQKPKQKKTTYKPSLAVDLQSNFCLTGC